MVNMSEPHVASVWFGFGSGSNTFTQIFFILTSRLYYVQLVKVGSIQTNLKIITESQI